MKLVRVDDVEREASLSKLTINDVNFRNEMKRVMAEIAKTAAMIQKFERKAASLDQLLRNQAKAASEIGKGVVRRKVAVRNPNGGFRMEIRVKKNADGSNWVVEKPEAKTA